MKKILFLILVISTITGCTQTQIVNDTNTAQDIQKSQSTVNTDWLIDELTQKFAEHNRTLQETNSIEIGYGETNVLGFTDSGVNVIVYDNNHEVLGNAKEFNESISRYSSDAYYGEVILQEKQVHPDVLLQYTKSSVMANHGRMKKEYFFTFPNNKILKVRVSFPADPEIDDSTQKELINNKINEIHDIILSD